MIDKYMYSADCILLCFTLDYPTSLENVLDKASNDHEMRASASNMSSSGFIIFHHEAEECPSYS